ncbi:TPA: FtsK/SpoIIIE domain-containing protein [Streptococcus suis]
MNRRLDVFEQLRLGMIELKFIGKGNIWIEDRFDDATKMLVQYFISESLIKTSVGQLEVIIYDGFLSGVFAPFSSLSAGENKLMMQLSSETALLHYLSYLKEHVRGIQNLIQGNASSLYNLRLDNQQVIESYKLVVIYTDIFLLDSKIKNALGLLSRVGPAAGVSFLIISSNCDLPFNGQSYYQMISTYQGKLEYGKHQASLPIISIAKIHERNNSLLQETRRTESEVIDFLSLPRLVNDSGKAWLAKSVDGLTFSIGKYGLEDVSITLGDELNQRHNMLITGAVGQGKSNLLSVIIHSLCQNYSPRELQLFLLDFKEGVSLKAFSNMDKEDYLPHARALGLESDVSFGLSIMTYLYQEYKRRLELFKQHNQKSIKEFREAFPNQILPRIVCVIDEFQLMFGDKSDEGRVIADYLEKSVRLFRAAGIHFILSSQTIGGNQILIGRMDSIFSQIPIRIAHKNSIAESQMTLGQGNFAAAYLKPREVIVNLDYGEVSQNKKVFVAYADERVLNPIRIKWWEAVKEKVPPPTIFSGSQLIKLSNYTDILKLRQAKANKLQGAAVFGREISVKHSLIKSRLKREIGHHIAIVGATNSKNNQALGMVQSVAISLAYLEREANSQFIFCHTFEQNSSDEKLINNLFVCLKELGVTIKVVIPEEFQITLQQVLEERKSQTLLKNSSNIYIFGLGMDRLRFQQGMDNLSFLPPGTGPLTSFLEEAADLGIHFIGWWIKVNSLEKQAFGIGIRNDLINTKIFLRVGEQSIKQFTGPFYSWQPEANRALYLDEVASEQPIPFIPFSPMDLNECQLVIKKLNKGE